MKSFKEFLLETNIDEALNNTEENIFSIMEDGELFEEKESFEDIANELFDNYLNGEKEVDGVEEGWGGEIYVSLDFSQLPKEETLTEKKSDGKKEMSDTLKTLSHRKEVGDTDDMDEIRFRNEQYKLDDDAKTILKRDFSSNSYKPLTDDEIVSILNQRNKNPFSSGVTLYDFDDDNNLITRRGDEVKIISSESTKRRLLKKLNDIVNSEKIHYRFVDTKNKNGDDGRMLINTTYWVKDGEEENIRNAKRFDNAEYKDVETDEEKQKILDIMNASALKKLEKGTDSSGKKLKKELGYDNGRFTLDGKEMSSEELKKLVIAINGNVGGDTKLINPSGWGKKTEKYWESYKISIAGSKVGQAVNFNLPPVVTCNKNVPCINEGCYAIKAYAAYPAARSAMDCNYALLRKDKGFELFKKSMILALTTKRKDDSNKFTLCRIHVNGDIFSVDYFGAICEIAKKCSDVHFWMYTKQYEILSEYNGNIPENLCVIVSCWGEFNPFDYKGGKYKDLAKNFPLAYLDDDSEECKQLNSRIQELIGKPKDIQVCPCTSNEEIITRCESCKICFDRSLASNNLVFRKH